MCVCGGGGGGGGGGRLKSGPFFYHKYESGIKSLMFLNYVDNIEHNVYTDMEVIFLTSMILSIKTAGMIIY